MRFAHYSSHLFYAAIALHALVLLVPSPSPYPVVSSTLVCAAVVAFVYGNRLHLGHLCERCAAAMPLNGAELAERRLLLFGAMHWLAGRWWRALLAVALLMAPVLALPGPTGSLSMLVAVAAYNWAGDQHQRLRLWCPYCRRGGRGPREEAPVVPPTPTTGR